MTRPAASRHLRSRAIVLLVYALLLLLAAFYLLPLAVMLLTSLKSLPEVHNGSLLALPQQLTLEPWRQAWSSACIGLTCDGIRGGFWNSVQILIPGVLFSILLGALTAYALTFWPPRGSRWIHNGLLLGAFIPYQVFIFPLIKLLSWLQLYGTLPGIIAIHVAFGLPLTVLLFKNYFVTLPPELIRSAQIDGAGFFHLFFAIILPMSLPIAAVAAIMQATGIWNDYLFGLIFAGRDHLPMTVQLNNIITTSAGDRPYNIHMAATLLSAAVPLIIYLLSGRWFIRGITAGALK